MEPSEQETIILINNADLKEGFFRFSTSQRWTYEKLLRRIGGTANLVGIQVHKTGGRPTQWNCKVPVKYLSKTTFGVRTRGVKK